MVPAGGEDPDSEPGFGGLQQELCALFDEQRGEDLRTNATQQERCGDLRRLQELQDPSVSHDWLWALNPVYGATVAPGEFGTALRIRLVAHLTEEPVLCRRCGKKMLAARRRS